MSLLNRVPFVPCMPTCQRAKSVPISHFYVPISERVVVAVPGAVYAYKNHTKISREYTAIKRRLRGLPSHTRTRDSPRIQR